METGPAVTATHAHRVSAEEVVRARWAWDPEVWSAAWPPKKQPQMPEQAPAFPQGAAVSVGLEGVTWCC